MEKKLLLLAVLFISGFAYSQVGIGTMDPKKSAQLDVESSNKGVLIPRVKLKDIKDIKTITSGNVESLLVYNITNDSNIKPGYYYWNGEEWSKLLSGDDAASIKNLSFNVEGDQFNLKDEKGTKISISLDKLNKVTTIKNQGNGSYVYTNEKDEAVTIDVKGTVINNFNEVVKNKTVKEVIEKIAKEVNGNVTYDATSNTFKYTDATGKIQNVNISEIVKAAETKTTLKDNGDGTYVYKNEELAEVTINIPAAVSKKFETIVNEGDVKNILNKIIKEADGNVSYDGNKFKYTTTDASGNKVEEEIDITNLVKVAETKTTLKANGDGTYVYTNEDLDEVTINIPAAVSKKFETIVNEGDVKNILNKIIKEADGNVSYDGNKFKYTTTDGSGNKVEEEIDITNLVKVAETKTTIVANGDGTYVYTNEELATVTIDVPADVTNQFQTIAGDTNVQNILNRIIKEADGNVSYDGNDLKYTTTDQAGKIVEKTIDLSSVVKANETPTTLVKIINIDKINGVDHNRYSLEYTNESLKKEMFPITEWIREGQTLTSLKVVGKQDNDKVIYTLTYIDEKGDSNSVDISALIKANQVLTTLTVDKKQVNGKDVYELIYKDEKGDFNSIDISSLVKAAETKTTIEYKNDGTYVYKNEKDEEVAINIPEVVADKFTDIVSKDEVKKKLTEIVKTDETKTTLKKIANIDIINGVNHNRYSLEYTDENLKAETFPITEWIREGQTLTSLKVVEKQDNNKIIYTLTYIDEKGDSNSVDISALIKAEQTLTSINVDKKQVNGKDVYELIYKDEKGDFNSVDITNLVKVAETETKLTDNGNGTYVYENELGATVTIDVPADVTNQFQTIANNDNVKRILNQIIKDAEGNVSYDGTNFKYSKTDGSGNTIEETIDINDLVKVAETKTTIVSNGDGTYVYTNEEGTQVTIDVPADVTNQFQKIAGDTNVKNILNDIVKNVEGNVSYDGTNFKYSKTDGSGNTIEETIDINDLVKVAETKTTIVSNGDGTYVYTNEELATVTIDVPADVTNQFQTIANNDNVKRILNQIIKDAEGNVSYDGTNFKYSKTDGLGNTIEETIDINDLVKVAETKTTIVDNGDGTYVYTNEELATVTIDVPADVTNQFQTIANNDNVKRILNQIIKDADGNVSYDGTNFKYSKTDGLGNTIEETIDINDLVKVAETKTTIVDNGDGTYVYTNEELATVTIDVPADVTNQFQTIANNDNVKRILNQIIKDADGNVSYDGTNFKYSKTDGLGNTIEETIDINDLVKVAETKTTIVDNGDGTYVYTNEELATVTIDVPADVTNQFQTIANNDNVKRILNQIIKDAEGNVSYDGTNFKYSKTDGLGNTIEETIDINDLVKVAETKTTIVDNGDGTYVYTNEEGTQVTIDVPADVTNQFQKIAGDTNVKNILNDIVKNVEGNVSYDGTNFKYSKTDGSGNTIEETIDINDLVKVAETKTTIVSNGDGTYVYTNEELATVTIDVPADVTNQFQTIANNDNVKRILNQIIKDAEGNVSYDGTNFKYSKTDGLGNTIEETIDINDLVKVAETKTTIVDNGDGTYVYTNEELATVTIDVPADVTNQFQTIANNDNVKRILNQIIKDADGNVSYDGTNFKYSKTDGLGNTIEETIDINDLVKVAETKTTIVDNGDGTYVYTNEELATVTIDVPADVTNQFQTIANNDNVKRILNQIIKDAEGNVSYDGTNFKYSKTDGLGNTIEETIDINDLVKVAETKTTIVDNGDGTYVYTNEEGTQVTIDVPADVTNQFQKIAGDTNVKNILNDIVKNVEGNVSYDGTNFKYSKTDGSGNTIEETIDINDLVKVAETKTTIVSNGDGTYVYTNEELATVTIDVPADVTNQFQTIANNDNVKRILNQIIKDAEGNVSYDGTNFKYSKTDGLGNTIEETIDINDLVKVAETKTTIVDNGDGTYVYTNEELATVTIDVPADVTNQFQTIANNDNVKRILNQIIKDTEGNVSYDGTNFKYSKTDGLGNTIEETIDINDLVKVAETKTTIVSNGDGTYVYTNEELATVTIDVPADVTNQFQTIANNDNVKRILNQIIKDTEGNVSYDGTNFKYSKTDGLGNTIEETIDINDLVKVAETKTTIVSNGDGTYVYTNEELATVTIDVPADVTNQFQTIANNDNVKRILNQIIKDADGNVSYDGTNFKYSKTDGSGNTIEETIDINDLVKVAETKTTIVSNGDGTYVYTNEELATVTIDVPADVTNQFQTIANNDNVKRILNQIIKDAEGNVSYDGTNFKYSKTDGLGNTIEETIDINDLVKVAETKTTIVSNGDGTYVYTNEELATVTIDVPADVTNQFQTIANNDNVKRILNQIIKDADGNVSYDGTNFKYSKTDGLGNTIEETIDINDLVKVAETKTTIVDNGDGTYVYTNEELATVTIDVPADVTNQFQTIANNDNVKRILNQIIKDAEGNVSYDGTNFKYSKTDGLGNTIEETIDINDLVKVAETKTTIVDNGDGTYVYTNEEGTQVTIDVPADVTNQFQKIAGDTNVKNILNDIVKNVEGNVSYDGTNFKYSKTDGSGNTIEETIDINDLVKVAETKTTIVSNGDGTYVYTNEELATVTIDVPADVTNQFQTIANNDNVKRILNQIIKDAEGNVSYDGTNFKYSKTDGSGNTIEETIDINDLVKVAETKTTIVSNGDGTYVYTNEELATVTIDVPADVTNQFQTIANNDNVKRILNQIIKDAEGNVSYDGTNFKYSKTDGLGNTIEETIDINDLVKVAETKTTIVSNGDGTYVYTNEELATVTIDVPADVTNQFQTIANNDNVKRILNQIIKDTEGNVSYDGTNFKYSKTDGLGNTIEETIDINDLVKVAETKTTIVSNGDGTYVYTNEELATVTIDVPADVTNQFQTIANNDNVKRILNQIIKDTEGNVSYDGTNFKYSKTDGLGNTIEETIDINDLVKVAETKTTIVDNGDGTYVYTNEELATVTIDVPADVTNQFQTIANNDNVKRILNQIIKGADGNVSYDGTNFKYSKTDGLGNTIEETIDINDLVKVAETKTTIVDNGDGTYVYTNEELATVTIDVPADVTNQFQTIANNDNVKRILNQIIKDAEGNVSYDGTNFKYSKTDGLGNTIEETIDINDLVKVAETKTTIVDNGDGTYVYTNEELATVTIDVPADVTNQFQKIAGDTNVKNILNDIVKNIEGNVSYDGNEFKYTITNQAGNKEEKVVDVTNLVKAAETVTTLSYDDRTGNISYKNEEAARQGADASKTINVNIPDIVANKFTDIVNKDEVKRKLTEIVKAEETPTKLETIINTDNVNGVDYNRYSLKYTNETPEEKTFPITEWIKEGQTLTSLTVDKEEVNGKDVYTLTYKDEKGNSNAVDISSLVKAKETETKLDVVNKGTADSPNYELTYLNEVGNSKTFNITSLVKENETVTKLDVVNKGTDDKPVYELTYHDEAGNSNTVDISLLKTKETPTTLEKVTNTDNVNGVDYNRYSLKYTNEVSKEELFPITEWIKEGQTLTSLTVDKEEVNGKDVYTLTYKDEKGNSNTVDISSLVKADETETELDVVNKGTADIPNHELTYKDEAGNSKTFNITSLVKENETVTKLDVVNKGTDDKPVYELTYHDEAGNSKTVDISRLLKSKETPTTLEKVTNTDNVNGVDYNRYSLKYTNEVSKEELFPITEWIKEGQTLTSLTVDKEEVNGKDVYTLTYKDEKGNSNAVDISSLVKADETETELDVVNKGTADSPNHELTYKDEAGNSKTFNITSLVKENETVTELKVEDKGTPDIPKHELTYKNEAGNSETVDITSIVKVNETVTSLLLDDTETKIDPDTNAELKVMKLAYRDEKGNISKIDIESIIKTNESLTSLQYDTQRHALIYRDEEGSAKEFMLTDLVGDVENLTTLSLDRDNKKLIYVDERKIPHNLDLAPIIQEPWFGVATNEGAISNTEDIYTQGWVGIGIDKPSGLAGEKLRVNGSISVVNGTYADYVFEDYFDGFSNIKYDYKFKDLNTVEDYIKTNRHLPGITPIHELEKTAEGYSFNISELSIQLLEKTEELYLHMIEQKNVIEQKDQQIKMLEEANNDIQGNLETMRGNLEAMQERLEKLERLLFNK